MQWRGRRQSDNVQDYRGGGGGPSLPGGFGRRPINIPIGRAGGGGLGIGGIVVLLIVCWIAGINPLSLLSGGDMGFGDNGTGGQVTQQQQTPASDETTQFISTVLAETEDVWNGIFQSQGRTYQEPKLVLFSGQVQSACGGASAATGPFYCPGDQKVYLDTTFFQQLSQQFGASGDFAQAYVIAHEVGHHVQNLLGTLPKVNDQRQRVDEAQSNALSVRTELQADCYAGVWANSTEQKGILEQGDLQEALNAAQQIGDDTLQRRSQGYVVPESFNHGTSAQRQKWLATGMKSGRLQDCDTFSNPI